MRVEPPLRDWAARGVAAELLEAAARTGVDAHAGVQGEAAVVGAELLGDARGHAVACGVRVHGHRITPHAPRPSPGLRAEREAPLHRCGLTDGEGWVLALARIDGFVEVDTHAPEEQGDLLADGADDAGDVLVEELRRGKEGDLFAGLVMLVSDPHPSSTRTACSRLVVLSPRIQELLGHKDIRVTQAYIKLLRDTRKSASHDVPL